MRAQRVARITAVFLGVFFIITGVAKVFMLNSFAVTIFTIISASSFGSNLIACFIISAEIVGGALLLLRFKLRLVAVLICVMLSVYIWLLYSSIMQGREIECNCFGILNISLPNFLELVLDFFIFDMTAVVAFVMTTNARNGRGGGFGISTVLIVLTIFFVQFRILSSAHETLQASSAYSSQMKSIFDLVRGGGGNSLARASGNCMVLLVDLYDFNCSICFDDFTALSDSIANHYGEMRDRVIGVFRSNEVMSSWSSSNIEKWARANHIFYPITVADEEMFTKAMIPKSTVVVFSPTGHPLLRCAIPTGVDNRKKLLRLILGN